MVQDMIYHIDVYDVMKRDIARFDTSDYSAYNAYGMPLANKKVPGLIKDENNDAIMIEFLERRCTRWEYAATEKDVRDESTRKKNLEITSNYDLSIRTSF